MAELSNIVAYGLGITAVDRDDAAAREFAALGQPAEATLAPVPPASAPAAQPPVSPWVWLAAAGVAVVIFLLSGGGDDGNDLESFEEDAAG